MKAAYKQQIYRNSLIRRTSGRILRAFQQINGLSDIGKHRTEKYFDVVLHNQQKYKLLTPKTFTARSAYF
jgi:hypothetical protein